ncbi:hypothetical protein G4O51_12840 [Candidatus Bathyarchaeota archaeon A05DMB-2]|nr:hypothetical protein [Candidatus Bathyarchaeota archaeon A05DMB-2]
MRRIVSGFILTLLLTGILALAFNVSQVKADGSWVWVRDTVTGAYGEAVVGTGNALYIATGTSFYHYLPANDSFVELASPPKPDGYAFKTGAALAWDFNDHIYALYGAATDDSRRYFYRYSISGNSWQALANTTYDQGEGNALTWVSVDNCIYATIGGEQRPTYLMRYDPSTNSWSDTPADPPDGMGDGASLVWTGGDYLYALRGEFLETDALYDYWRYSLTDNSWTAMADIPALPHSGGSGGVGDGGSLLYVGLWLPSHTDYIYALSGNQAHPDNIPDNRTYRYTISTNSWERLADLPFGVGYYVGCRLGYAEGHIYVWQGAPSTWTGGGDDLAKYRLAWIVDDDGPADFHTIQEAINAANPGDTIYVKAGTYYENVLVNKTVLLIGENRENTFIDGGGNDTVLKVTVNDVTISNFTIQHSGGEWADSGIDLSYSANSHIVDNNILNNYFGIGLGYNNTLTQNNVFNNQWGIREYGGGNHVLIGNNVYSNHEGIYLYESGNTILIRNNVFGNDFGITLEYSEGSNITSNNLHSNGGGIYIGWSSNSYLLNNTISNNAGGITIFDSFRCTLMNNTLSNNQEGIRLSFCHGSKLKGNKMTSNGYNFGVYDWTLLGYFLDVDTSNLVNGKPVYYMINQTNLIIEPTSFPQIGYLALINSTNITIRNQTFASNYQGLLLAYTTNSLIENVKAINNKEGVYLWDSNDNVLSRSNVLDNEYGIYLFSSDRNALVENAIGNNTEGIYTSQSTYSSIIGNTVYSNKYGIHLYWSPRGNVTDNNILSNEYGIYLEDLSINNIFHNNFLGNIYQVSISGRSYDNIWDSGYPSGGNFWDDYGKLDTNGDFIGDTPYIINDNNQDRYPLVVPHDPIPIIWDETIYPVELRSNSTICRIRFIALQRTISFNVTGADGTLGFCNLTIPNTLVQDLWQGNFTVLVDGTEPFIMNNWTDDTNTYIYFTYQHSTHEVIIIPEFSSSLILPILMIVTLLVLIVHKSKRKAFNVGTGTATNFKS